MRGDLTSGITGDANMTGGAAWRTLARRLQRYLRRDMSDAVTQRLAMYPKNGHKHVLRTIPFIWRLARELSAVERARSFTAPDGTALPPETVSLIEGIYRDAQIDRRMRTAHEHVIGLNQATLWVWPDETTGGIRAFVAPIADQETDLGATVSLIERDVVRWWLRLPIMRDPMTGTVYYGIARITHTEAVWEEAPGDLVGKPIWRGACAAGIADIPVVMIRGADPGPGEWWSPLPHDLDDAQSAINHDQTDLGVITRLQGYSQATMKGVGPESAKGINTSPEEIICTGLDGEFAYASPTPDLEGNVAQLTQYVQMVVSSNGLNPATLMKSAGVTALAKQIELIDRDTERRRHFIEFDRAEQRLYCLIRKWINLQRGMEVLPEARVTVEYRDVYIPADPLHEAQATKMFCDMSMTSPVRARAKLEGCSLDEAERRCMVDEAYNKRFADSTTEVVDPADPTTDVVDSAPADAKDAAATDAPDGSPPALDAAPGSVQTSALNGAQVEALKGIVESVVAGQLPAEAARQLILMSFPVAAASVASLLSSLASFDARTTVTQTPPPVGA